MTIEDLRPAMPPLVDCGTWQGQVAAHREREKAHPRAGVAGDASHEEMAGTR